MRDAPRALALLALALALHVPASPARADDAAAGYDALLHEAVRGGAPDWALLRQRGLAPLDRYLAELARVDTGALAPAERTAYWLNLYDAAFLREAARRVAADPAWTPAAERFAIFRRDRLVPVGERGITLDSLARGIVLPRARDPRVLLALVVGARSSAPFPARAFRGRDLDATLAAAMRAFVRDGARNRVDPATRTLVLSRLFDWYAPEFGGRGALAAYVGRFAGRDCAGWTVTFADWDWGLAAAPPRR